MDNTVLLNILSEREMMTLRLSLMGRKNFLRELTSKPIPTADTEIVKREQAALEQFCHTYGIVGIF